MVRSCQRALLAAIAMSFVTVACGVQSTGGRREPPASPAVTSPASSTSGVAASAGATAVIATPTATTPSTVAVGVSPTSLPIEGVVSGRMPLTGQPLDYVGIFPGKSTRADVESRLGPPNVVRSYQSYESLHYFTNGKEYFLLKDGIVQAASSNKLGGFTVSQDLEQKFPGATVLTPDFGPPTRVLPTLGLAFSAYAYQFLKPMTLDEYVALWNHYPVDVDPFPLIPSVEAAGVAPGRTTRSQVESLLGPPDRKVTENRNVPWLYDVEPDLLGRLMIFFDEGGRVKNMDISESRRKRLLSLEEAVSQYGDPDFVQLIPGTEAGGQMTQALLYLQRGLRVGAGCFGPACSVVQRETPVSQKWYFAPTTIDDYRKDFTNSQFVPWHGFDK